MNNAAVRGHVLQKLQDFMLTEVDLATQQLTPDATAIAVKVRERQHVEGWPKEQLEVLRTAVTSALQDPQRPLFFDWEFADLSSITIRDNGEGVFVTFRSPPDV